MFLVFLHFLGFCGNTCLFSPLLAFLFQLYHCGLVESLLLYWICRCMCWMELGSFCQCLRGELASRITPKLNISDLYCQQGGSCENFSYVATASPVLCQSGYTLHPHKVATQPTHTSTWTKERICAILSVSMESSTMTHPKQKEPWASKSRHSDFPKNQITPCPVRKPQNSHSHNPHGSHSERKQGSHSHPCKPAGLERIVASPQPPVSQCSVLAVSVQVPIMQGRGGSALHF